jgi:hypothetical protein
MAARAGQRQAGGALAPRRGTAQQLPQRDGAAQVQVRVVLPGEPDPAEHLDAVLGVVNGGVQRAGGRGGRRYRQFRRSVVSRTGRVPGQYGCGLGPDQQPGAQVLDCLECADRPAELMPDRRVLGRRSRAPGRDRGRLDGGQHGREVADRGCPGLRQQFPCPCGNRVEAHVGQCPGEVGRGVLAAGDAGPVGGQQEPADVVRPG